jgi:hypothetical protein
MAGMGSSPAIVPFGALFGFCVGLGGLVPVALLVCAQADLGERTAWTVIAILASAGGIGGAIIGATRDILVSLRRAFPPQHGPEADYCEPDRPG